jgi:hypothetical protein
MSVKCPTPLHAALFELTLFDADLHTGDTEFGGNTWWFRVTEPETFDVPEYGEVTVPIGNYGITEDDQGHVTVAQYATWEDAETEHARIDAAYGEWLDSEGCG